MRIARLLLLAFILFVVGGCCSCRVTPGGQAIAPQPLIVDVRTEQEWNTGHLQGAVLIPHDRIDQGIGAVAPDKKTKIYLYCRTGRRTGIAFDTLKKMGYQDLVNLETVEKASRELNLPIVK